jgi:4-hydroxy-tetrahydrodipicolinate synthase
MEFGRLITAMVTPFDEQGLIDWDQTKRLMDYLIEEQKTESLVICGTTGESPTLSEAEKLELFKFTVNYTRGRCKIIAGTGSNSTAHSIALTEAAEKCGVDGILLVAPYYNRPNQEGLYRHFKAIAQATVLPVILYNVPSRTAVSISAETTIALSKIPNIIATKECAGLDQVAEIAANTEDGFKIYSGDDSSFLPALAVGAYGLISVSSHVAGSKIKDMIDAFINGETTTSAKIHQHLLPLFKGLFKIPNPVAVKYALVQRGLQVGSVRLPLVGPTDEEAQEINELIAKY